MEEKLTFYYSYEVTEGIIYDLNCISKYTGRVFNVLRLTILGNSWVVTSTGFDNKGTIILFKGANFKDEVILKPLSEKPKEN